MTVVYRNPLTSQVRVYKCLRTPYNYYHKQTHRWQQGIRNCTLSHELLSLICMKQSSQYSAGKVPTTLPPLYHAESCTRLFYNFHVPHSDGTNLEIALVVYQASHDKLNLTSHTFHYMYMKTHAVVRSPHPWAHSQSTTSCPPPFLPHGQRLLLCTDNDDRNPTPWKLAMSHLSPINH